MRMKRTTGLLLSLALTVLPATAALARPVASHHLFVSWNSNEFGTFMNGSIDFVIDESGTPTVDFKRVETRPCEDGVPGSWTKSIVYRGVASLSVAIDRHLSTISIAGDLPASQTITSTCGGLSVVESVSDVSVNLSGLSNERLVRSRDRDSGDRTISRFHGFVLGLNEELILGQGMLTKTISRA